MKKLFITLLILIGAIILLVPTSVRADSFTFVATPNKTGIEAGEEIEITLGIADIDVGQYGINTLETTLSYDTNVFEPVTQESFTSKNNWSITYNDEDTEYKGKILAMILIAGEKEDKTIGTLKLKAKENIDSINTVVKFVDVTTNNGTDLVTDTDKEINISIGESFPTIIEPGDDEPGSDIINPGDNGNGSGTVIDNGNNNKGSQSGTTDSTVTTDKKMPQTGAKEIVYGSIATSTIAFLVIGYIKFKKYSEI